MKLLDGIETPEYGHVHVRPGIRVSLLVQQPEFGPDETLMDVARSVWPRSWTCRRELEEAAREMAEADDQVDSDRAPAGPTSSTSGWSTRTPTRSIIASRRSSADCSSRKRTSTVRPARSLGDSSRG